jgi:hypothetical protein
MYVPFPYKGRPKNKKDIFKIIPPSPKVKIDLLNKECDKVNEQKLKIIFQSYFNDEIRNAFYHSDYTITDTEFRICESGLPIVVSLVELSEKLARCFAFYQAFFDVYKGFRRSFIKSKKLHRLPNYEVIQLLADKKEGLVGFKIYFSNNSVAFFERRKERVNGINIMLEKDHINFMAGDLNKLQRKWIVNGKLFREKNTKYNDNCEWRPILFYGNTHELLNEIQNESSDEVIQGCIFYLKTTGHETIEFTIKSDKKLPELSDPHYPIIKLVECEAGSGIFIYDGAVYINSLNVKMFSRGLNKINKLVTKLQNDGYNITYALKYLIKSRPKNMSKNSDGKSFVRIELNDPRNTLCTSNLNILPNKNWKIRKEWID